jgi:predicted HAD superfamily phosphohydrolase YqeG
MAKVIREDFERAVEDAVGDNAKVMRILVGEPQEGMHTVKVRPVPAEDSPTNKPPERRQVRVIRDGNQWAAELL